MPVELLCLPEELVSKIATYLTLNDLKIFRLTSARLGREGFDALLPFIRTKRKFDIRSDDGIADLIFLAQTPKARDTVKRLKFRSKIISLDQILSELYFPQLETLVVEDSVMSTAHLVTLLLSHATTLRRLRLEYVKLITTPWKLKEGRTSGWSRVLEFVASRLHLSELTTLYLSYYAREGEPVQITPYPEKRCGKLLARNCCKVEEYEDGAFIDVDMVEAITTEAMTRIAGAFIDDNGKERYQTADDERRPARYPDLCELGVDEPGPIYTKLPPKGARREYLDSE